MIDPDDYIGLPKDEAKARLEDLGLKVTQRVMPTGPWIDAMRRGDFEVVSQANCHGVPNPLMDV